MIYMICQVSTDFSIEPQTQKFFYFIFGDHFSEVLGFYFTFAAESD